MVGCRQAGCSRPRSRCPQELGVTPNVVLALASWSEADRTSFERVEKGEVSWSRLQEVLEALKSRTTMPAAGPLVMNGLRVVDEPLPPGVEPGAGRMGEGMNRRHGEARSGKRTAEYRAWLAMKRRCDPTSAVWWRYWGRGITVCRRWERSFEEFLADVGRRPVAGPRKPGPGSATIAGTCARNVRWSTSAEQRRKPWARLAVVLPRPRHASDRSERQQLQGLRARQAASVARPRQSLMKKTDPDSVKPDAVRMQL